MTVTALETSKIVMWHRDRVKFCLMEDQELQAIFDHVVGRDVVRKLMQVGLLRTEKEFSRKEISSSLVSIVKALEVKSFLEKDNNSLQ